jgi:hypothetical protein
MKKIILIMATLFVAFSSFSQWTTQSVNNGFDDPYKIAYTSKNNGAILKLENVEGDIYFYIQGGYYCDDNPLVEFIFVINGQNFKFTREGLKNDKNDVVFFTGDLINSELYEPFKQCSLLKIRINETYCDNDTHTFNMSKSTSALNSVINQ